MIVCRNIFFNQTHLVRSSHTFVVFDGQFHVNGTVFWAVVTGDLGLFVVPVGFSLGILGVGLKQIDYRDKYYGIKNDLAVYLGRNEIDHYLLVCLQHK